MAEEKYKMKMAVISGASHALDFKEKNPLARKDEVMQKVTDSVEEIIAKIDADEDL